MVRFEPSFSENKSVVTEEDETHFVYREMSMTRRVIVAVLVTTLTFFLVYDRMAIDGVLLSLQQYFSINDSTTALLQTFQAISSALFFISIGMIGDKIERKRLVIMAVSIWFVLVFLSLIVGKGMFWAYLLLRTMSAFAYAVVCSLGPVIVSDIFDGRARGYCLMALSIAPLIGSLLAMSISSWFLTSGYSWHAAMLISPAVVLPVTIGLVFTMPRHEPTLNINKATSVLSLGFIEEIKSLFSVKTYALLVFGATFSNLYQRAMSFWMPTILLYGYMANGAAFYFNLPFPVVMLITLILGFTALLIGMPLSMWIAESWQQGKNVCSGRPFSRAIPLFVTLSTIIYSLISATAITMFVRAYPVYLACMFFNSLFTGGAAPLTTQIVLDVSPKWNRAAAMAIYNLFVGLADSPSSLIVGSLSDVFRGETTDPMSRYNAFVYALYILLGCNFISAALYGTATVFYPSDLAASQDDDMLSMTSDEDAPLLKGALNRRASIVERGLLSRKATLDTTLL